MRSNRPSISGFFAYRYYSGILNSLFSEVLTVHKLNFWHLYALVLGSQIGSGIFMLPSSLAQYGWYALMGWCVAGFGAVCLALVFVELVARVTKTGGPHVFVEEAFASPVLTFFTGWTYWLVSSTSTVTVIASAVSYLSPFLYIGNPWMSAGYQLAFLAVFTALNLRGVSEAGRVEVVLMLIKLVTLLCVPCAAFYFFNAHNIQLAEVNQGQSAFVWIAKASKLTFWAFVGLEAATAPADSVDNPKQTIPKALILGTLSVLALYVLNSFAIGGLLPAKELAASQAPYALAVETMFGARWSLLLSFVAGIVFLSNLNAWLLTSGQVAYGLAKSGYLPNVFTQVNKYNAPSWALIVSAAVMVPLLLTTLDSNISQQVEKVIDLSVASVVYIYLLCALALLRLLSKEDFWWKRWSFYITLLSTLFCIMVLMITDTKILLMSALFVLSGIPVYVFWYAPTRRMKRLMG